MARFDSSGSPPTGQSLPAAPPLFPVAASRDAFVSAALAGLIATSVMSVVLVGGYAVAALLGVKDSSSVLLRWVWGLANNSLTERTQELLPVAMGLHFLSGLVWALAYVPAEPRLKGPGWRRGAVFSIGPWILSVVVFFPLVGGGLLGFGFGAGPLPIAGNLVVHAVYGIILGQVYTPWGRRLLSGKTGPGATEELRLVAREESVVAVGIASGVLVGGLLAGLAGVFNLIPYRPSSSVLLGAVAGSLIGAFVASFLGFSQEDS